MLNSHTGIMARRLLVNWRVRPDAVQAVLPKNFRPHLLHGHAIAGLCLVRLEHFRPAGFPAFLGLASENVAARIGVELDSPAGPQHAVLILRRDTNSRVNAALAKHVGFGVHHFAPIYTHESDSQIHIRMTSPAQSLSVHLSSTHALPPDSAFHSLADAHSFFRGSEIGYSPAKNPNFLDAAKLHLHSWNLAPLALQHAHSSFIETLFPNAATPDSAFIMRDIPHTWTALDSIPLHSPAPALPMTRAAPLHPNSYSYSSSYSSS